MSEQPTQKRRPADHSLPTSTWFESLLHDIRHACRGMRRSPGFTAITVMTLAIGIGINAAVFTVARASLFKGFPLVKNGDRIVYLTTNRNAVRYPDFLDWRAQAASFEGIALVRGVFTTLSGDSGAPATYFTTEITTNAFQLLGVTPMLGRDFVASDQEAGAAPVVILRHDIWRSRFGQDPNIIGRTVRLNGVPTTIVGVMPPSFSFAENQSLWIPLVPASAALTRDTFYARYAFGRLAVGATIESARVEMDTIGRRLAATYPRTNGNLVPVVRDFGEFFIGASATAAYAALWGAAGFVLLIACSNVANLLLQRAIGRSRDIAVRIALGASRGRILRQLLVESLLLSGVAGVVGWWIAQAAVRAYTLARGGGVMTDVLSYTLDSRVLTYLAAITIATGLLVGVPATIRLTRSSVNRSLRASGPGFTEGMGGRRLSDVLVTVEVALTLMLLSGAGLMTRSVLAVYSAEVGVNTSNVLTMSMYIPSEQYPDAASRVGFYQRLVTRLESVPGVESVALGTAPPTEAIARSGYELAGADAVEEEARPTVAHLAVSPDYWRTLQARVVSGREFSDLDQASTLPVAIVNQTFAARNWPREDAVGRRLRMHLDGVPQEWLTVVGVASDIVQDDRTRQERKAVVYVPYQQRPSQNMFVFARTRVAPENLAPTFASQVYEMDANLPVPTPMPLALRFDRAYAFERNLLMAFLLFATVALLLAVVGLYATVAHSVSRRIQEIGIRMAVGATTRDIRRLVFRQGALPLGIGLVTGLAASLAVTRVLESVLVRVSPVDPATLVAVSLVMIIPAALGCLLPARHAVRVDPVVALRYD